MIHSITTTQTALLQMRSYDTQKPLGLIANRVELPKTVSIDYIL